MALCTVLYSKNGPKQYNSLFKRTIDFMYNVINDKTGGEKEAEYDKITRECKRKRQSEVLILFLLNDRMPLQKYPNILVASINSINQTKLIAK